MPWTGSCTPRLSLDLPIQNYPPQFSIPSSTNQCAHAGILKFSVSYRSKYQPPCCGGVGHWNRRRWPAQYFRVISGSGCTAHDANRERESLAQSPDLDARAEARDE